MGGRYCACRGETKKTLLLSFPCFLFLEKKKRTSLFYIYIYLTNPLMIRIQRSAGRRAAQNVIFPITETCDLAPGCWF